MSDSHRRIVSLLWAVRRWWFGQKLQRIDVNPPQQDLYTLPRSGTLVVQLRNVPTGTISCSVKEIFVKSIPSNLLLAITQSRAN
jgi:hypothetical protein